jgi:hypothetical protein
MDTKSGFSTVVDHGIMILLSSASVVVENKMLWDIFRD